jgi:hypothetical protein
MKKSILGTLYASGGHLEPPSHRVGGWPGDLPLQGLPAWPSPPYPDARGRGILTAADVARPPTGLPTDTALRLPREPGAAGQARTVPHPPRAGHAPHLQAKAVDLRPPEASAAEPGALCPVCQHGRMQLSKTLYRQPAAWDLLAVPTPGLDTS